VTRSNGRKALAEDKKRDANLPDLSQLKIEWPEKRIKKGSAKLQNLAPELRLGLRTSTHKNTDLKGAPKDLDLTTFFLGKNIYTGQPLLLVLGSKSKSPSSYKALFPPTPLTDIQITEVNGYSSMSILQLKICSVQPSGELLFVRPILESDQISLLAALRIPKPVRANSVASSSRAAASTPLDLVTNGLMLDQQKELPQLYGNDKALPPLLNPSPALPDPYAALSTPTAKQSSGIEASSLPTPLQHSSPAPSTISYCSFIDITLQDLDSLDVKALELPSGLFAPSSSSEVQEIRGPSLDIISTAEDVVKPSLDDVGVSSSSLPIESAIAPDQDAVGKNFSLIIDTLKAEQVKAPRIDIDILQSDVSIDRISRRREKKFVGDFKKLPSPLTAHLRRKEAEYNDNGFLSSVLVDDPASVYQTAVETPYDTPTGSPVRSY